jgi:hypothetical protein
MTDRSSAQRLRDAALARISRVRTATVIAAGALTAAIAGIVSAVAPGRTLGTKPPATHASTRLVMPPLENPGQLGLQGPSSPPQSAPAAPQTQTQTQPAPQPAPPSATSGGS